MSNNIIFFKNIKFYNLSPRKVLKKMIDEGGYLVAPAASSLQTISKNKSYHRALQDSTIAILDSGFFCILLSNDSTLMAKHSSPVPELKSIPSQLSK